MFGDVLFHSGLAIYVVASLGLLVFGLNAYVMVGLMLHHRRHKTAADRTIRAGFDCEANPLPVVTTQLPIYNERHVVERLLRAICALEYPAGQHEIQVLDDSTDDTSERVAELVTELQATGHDIQHIRREHRRGYKAGALAEGLRVARGEFIAIFDADFVPPPDFLHATIPFLLADERCSFVQTRWGHRNRSYSLLTRLQGIGIDGHFVVEQTARSSHGLAFNFNGTAGVWRSAAIADAGGWTADTLTEDLDLSYRTLLRGWRPCYLPDVVTPAELPTDINALKSQQRRWATGSIQCAIKLLPQIIRSPRLGVFAKGQAVLHLTHYLIHPLILTLTILVLPLVLTRGVMFAESLTLPLAAIMVVSLFGPSTLYVVSQAAEGESWRQAVFLMPVLIGFGIGLAVNNTLAVARAVRGDKGGEFVRTPKLGARAEDRGSPAVGANSGLSRDYRPTGDRTYLGELFLGAWTLAACIVFSMVVGPGKGILLALEALGFTSVGILSLLHRSGRGRPSLARPSA